MRRSQQRSGARQQLRLRSWLCSTTTTQLSHRRLRPRRPRRIQ
jgi:hypothetical protein